MATILGKGLLEEGPCFAVITLLNQDNAKIVQGWHKSRILLYGAAQDFFCLTKPTKRKIGRANGRERVDVKPMGSGGAVIGFKGKFVFARLHQSVPNDQAINRLAAAIDTMLGRVGFTGRADAADKCRGQSQRNKKPRPHH